MADLKASLRFDVKAGEGVATIKNVDRALGGVGKAEARVDAATRRANRTLGRQVKLAKQAGGALGGLHQKALSYGGAFLSFRAAAGVFGNITRATIR